jgi:hypothetical protein
MPGKQKKSHAPLANVKKATSHGRKPHAPDSPRPLDIEAAKLALRDVLRAEIESETVPSEVLSFRMKGSRRI